MDFRGDERGQPVQIGFILLFGILVLAFAGYQGYVVPNQNSQVEFQHSQDTVSDMQTFREDFLGAAEDGRRFSAGFDLGTGYPARLVALNPPPASGKLRTETPGDGRFHLDAGEQSLAEICGIEQGGDGGVPSNALVYQPSYNEHQNPSEVVYENTVTYNRFSRNDVVRFTSEQTLIQGREIMIPPLVGDVSADGTERRTIDLYPGRAGVGKASGTDVTLTVPTELSEDRWRSLLGDEMGENGRVEAVNQNGSDVDIVLESGSYDVTCPVIGAGDRPENRPARVRGEDDDINPAAPGGVQLVGADWGDDENTVNLTFENSGEENNFTEGRINFYHGNNNPEEVVEVNAIGADRNPRGENWPVMKEARDLSPDIVVEGEGGNTSVELVFSGNTNVNQDFFVVTFTLETGERATYFVGGEF